MPRACFSGGAGLQVELKTLGDIIRGLQSGNSLKAPNEPAQLHEPGYAEPKACALLYSANFTSGLPKRDRSN